MKPASVIKIAMIGAAAAALVALGAAPALAGPSPRTLPVGQDLYAVGCDLNYNANFASVDQATGAVTLIGNNAANISCGWNAAWDAANHTAYYIDWDQKPGALIAQNLVTGGITDLGTFDNGSSSTDWVDAIMIGTNGAAYALDDHNLYSLDLANAQLTEIAPLVTDTDAAAYDPANGNYYIVGDDNTVLQTVNVTTGALTDVGTLPVPSINSIQFDASGTMWFTGGNGDQDYSALWTVLPSALSTSAIEAGTLLLGSNEFYSSGLLLTSPTPGVSLSTAKVAAGGTVTVTGTGFVAGESVDVYLDSSSTAAATLTASGTGTVSATVTIPKTDAGGTHTIRLVGAASGAVSAAVTVVPALATTGVDAQWPLEFGGILLLLGAVVVVARRLNTKRAHS